MKVRRTVSFEGYGCPHCGCVEKNGPRILSTETEVRCDDCKVSTPYGQWAVATSDNTYTDPKLGLYLNRSQTRQGSVGPRMRKLIEKACK